MSNLTPQLRADKTGKLVTRHVRVDSRPVASRASIPKPMLASGSAQPVDNSVDEMDKPFTLGPFHWRSDDKVISALHEEYNRDESQQVELTSRGWLAARREGLFDRRIHSFLLAGITDPVEMREFAQKYDKSLSPSVKPGVHAKRKAWVDSLSEAGVTKEQYDAADRNFGSYDGITTVLEDFDFKGNPADVVKMYAEYSNMQTRQALNEFIYDGRLSLEQLKEIGVSRVRKYRDVIETYIDQNGTDDVKPLVTVIKHDEKAFSILSHKASRRIKERLFAIKRWGMDRAMELKEPSIAMHLPSASESMEDKGFALAKHYESVLYLSVQRGSTSLEPSEAYPVYFSESKEYAHLGDRKIYKPQIDTVLEYYRVGLTPEETIVALENGVDAIAARGVKEGATPAVASGWL